MEIRTINAVGIALSSLVLAATGILYVFCCHLVICNKNIKAMEMKNKMKKILKHITNSIRTNKINIMMITIMVIEVMDNNLKKQ